MRDAVDAILRGYITSVAGGPVMLTHNKPCVAGHFSFEDRDDCLGTSELFLVITGEVALG
jgi:hypothetical protein